MPAPKPKGILTGNFELAWHPGRRVQENASPFRKGTIIRRLRTGNTAVIIVSLDGGHAQGFPPGGLTLL